MKKALLTIFTVLVLDQWLKLWVKLNFHYGESVTLIPGWLDLQFVENPGMAFGWMLPGQSGKLVLSIFRILVVTGISWYLVKLIRQKAHTGYIICVSLIIAGALGNIIDSAVYGLLFDRGSTYDPEIGDYTMYFGKALLNGQGYAAPLMGNVVDMFHFTKRITIGGVSREIFPPVFNIADASISIGILLILLFQKRYFPKESNPAVIPASADHSDNSATASDLLNTPSDVENKQSENQD
ncbi:MAG TPA: lipoprotein signal peptidase [Flavobacteriales bacterium]